MKKEKTKFILSLVLLAMVFVTFVIWGFEKFNSWTISMENISIPIFMTIILSLLTLVLVRNYKSIKQNMPTEDERTKKANIRAASISFFISIYLLLFIGWLGDDFFERPSQATGLAIGVMSIVYISMLLYFQRRGKF